MNFDNITDIQINSNGITELRINGVLVWEKNTISNDLVLSFTGENFSVDSSSQGLTGQNIVINWGDGTKTNYTSASDLNHTYSASGDYSITISKVIGLEASCFLNCTGLTSINIPDSVISLGSQCFRGCSGLTNVVIPNSITSLERSCFSLCSSLTSIIIPDSVTSIGSNCFARCSGLTNIVMSNNVTSLGDFCFLGCSNLTNVIIPDSVISLGYQCFKECSHLTSIEIPEGVTNLGNGCFNNCSRLTSLICNWESNPPSYNSNWITSANSSLKFSIPYGTTSIYTATGYPSDKLVEREEEHGGVTPKQIVDNIVLTSNKSVLSAYDSDTCILTATVNGTNVDGLEVEFFNGSTSMGTSIVTNGVATKSYTATGSGNVTITAECMNVSEIYTIHDCLWGTDGSSVGSLEIGSNVSCTSNGEYITITTSTSGEKQVYLPVPLSPSDDWEYSVEIASIGTVNPLAVVLNNTTNYGGYHSSTAKWFLDSSNVSSTSIQVGDIIVFQKQGTTLKMLLNETQIASKTVTMNNNAKVGFYTNNGRVQHLKNIMLKIDNNITPTNNIALTSDKSVLSAYNSDTCTLTATVTGENVDGLTVEFFNGTTSLGTAIVSNGVATKSYSATGAGDISVSAQCGVSTSNTITIEDCIYTEINQIDITKNDSYSQLLNNDVISNLPNTYKIEFDIKTLTAPTSGLEQRIYWAPQSLWTGSSQPNLGAFVGYSLQGSSQIGLEAGKRLSGQSSGVQNKIVTVNTWYNIRIENIGSDKFYFYCDNSYYTWWTINGHSNYSDWIFGIILWSPTTLSIKNLKIKPL